MPKLWSETIEAHRTEVREAVLDTTAALVAGHGLLSVTMSQIAEEAGIGRATLYKYFPDVEAILLAWHEREIAGHFDHLTRLRERISDPDARLEAVLEGYALLARGAGGHHDTELAALLHRGEHVARAERRLHGMVTDLIAEGVANGDIRADVAPEELADYCLHALTASRSMTSKTAVRRLVTVTMDGLRPNR